MEWIEAVCGLVVLLGTQVDRGALTQARDVIAVRGWNHCTSVRTDSMFEDYALTRLPAPYHRIN